MASAERVAAEVIASDGERRYQWSVAVCRSATSAGVLMETILERRRWREQYELAKSVIGGTGPPVETNSATAVMTNKGGSNESEAAGRGPALGG